MSIDELVAAGIATVSLLGREALTSLAKKTGDDLHTEGKHLLDLLKTRFSGRADATKTLSLVEADPLKARQLLEPLIREALATDSHHRHSIEELLRRAASLKVDTRQTARIISGAIGVDAEQVVAGDIQVTQEADTLTNTVGIRIKNLG